MADIVSTVVDNYNYWIYITLMMIGLYAIIAKNNLVKKIVGMNIFQTAIILFYVSIGAKRGATIPILEHGHGAEEDARQYQEHALTARVQRRSLDRMQALAHAGSLAGRAPNRRAPCSAELGNEGG